MSNLGINLQTLSVDDQKFDMSGVRHKIFYKKITHRHSF